MADLLILPGGNQAPCYRDITDDGEQYSWQEPAPASVPAGALPYRRLGALNAWNTPSPFIYTVELDVAEADVPELTRWYEQEHLGMLAAVPGCLGASRYEAIGANPFRFLACYRFEDPGIPETPAWIAARSTPWTLAMRDRFRNARRFKRRLL